LQLATQDELTHAVLEFTCTHVHHPTTNHCRHSQSIPVNHSHVHHPTTNHCRHSQSIPVNHSHVHHATTHSLPSLSIYTCQSINHRMSPSVHPSIRSRSVRPSISPYVRPSICRRSVRPSVHRTRSVDPSGCRSVRRSIHPSVGPFVRLSVRSSVNPSVCLCPSICRSVRPSVDPSVRLRPSVGPSIHLLVHPSVRQSDSQMINQRAEETLCQTSDTNGYHSTISRSNSKLSPVITTSDRQTDRQTD